MWRQEARKRGKNAPTPHTATASKGNTLPSMVGTDGGRADSRRRGRGGGRPVGIKEKTCAQSQSVRGGGGGEHTRVGRVSAAGRVAVVRGRLRAAAEHAPPRGRGGGSNARSRTVGEHWRAAFGRGGGVAHPLPAGRRPASTPAPDASRGRAWRRRHGRRAGNPSPANGRAAVPIQACSRPFTRPACAGPSGNTIAPEKLDGRDGLCPQEGHKDKHSM